MQRVKKVKCDGHSISKTDLEAFRYVILDPFFRSSSYSSLYAYFFTTTGKKI